LHDQGGRFPLVAPLLPVVAQWGKDAWDAHNEGKQDAPEILLPPGVEDE
jgi:hypothetical protein